MKTTRMMKYSVLFVVIVILFTSSPFAIAQSQDGYHPQGIFNLQFVLIASWGIWVTNQALDSIEPMCYTLG